MARSTRVLSKSSPRSNKASSSVMQSHPSASSSPRRSPRLRSSPQRPDATLPTAPSPKPENLRGNSHERRQSLYEQLEQLEQEQQQYVAPTLSGKGALARVSAGHLPPNADAPRSPNKLKRRRGLDHYDLVPSSPHDLDNELTTPRTLRALKRQRLLFEAPATPEPSPSGDRHDRPASPSSGEHKSQPEPGCPELPPKQADSDLCIVQADATAPAEAPAREEPDASYGEDEAEREQSGSDLSQSVTESVSPAPAPAMVVEEMSDEDVMVAELSGAESPSIGDVTDLATACGPSQSVSADLSASPAPASNDALPPPGPSSAPVPQQPQQAPEPALEEAQPQPPAHSEPEVPLPPAPLAVYLPTPAEQWAQIAANINLPQGAAVGMSLPRWRYAVDRASLKASRGMRPRNVKAEAWVGTWKHEMMVRVEAVMEWATAELVRVYNELQTRDDAVDFYNFSAEHLPDDVVGMMDVDQPEAHDVSAEDMYEDDDSDDEDEDDEDFDVPDNSHVIMEVDSIEPAPEFVQGNSSSVDASDVTEEPNSAPEAPQANLTMPPSSIPPRFRNLTPKLPRLFSFHTGPFELPQTTPDGVPYVGRGTPVDRRRLDDWASPPPPRPPRYTASEESWFSSLVTTPSIISGNTSSLTSDATFGVPTEVGPFCCTQDGLYGAEGSVIPPDYSANGSVAGASTSTGVGADAFNYPTPQDWIEPTLRAPSEFPAFPGELTEGFAGTAPAPEALPPATQQTNTGCMFHRTLLECLTSGLGCVSGPFAGMPMPPPPPTPTMVPCNVEAANPPGVSGVMDVGTYDVSMEPVSVQASSALSHALG
ncbi:uncharacterized protein C8Q71DRAFT_856652 [Rhodofomes roseus]|uniref:Uncharacterized protein n=1 Tax=Rhodofomes roseus TaxID=34475 RepID=A0ABQ8KLA4_9APHY|nr:uncharacterized protein C8Q71DRAFT_856652 [Rhodofomes roseus]KAH9838723.1 hypothetical protein C8Q71DRAFT_856652 [Rhodofomes roseus]